jgi:hypothetical protein
MIRKLQIDSLKLNLKGVLDTKSIKDIKLKTKKALKHLTKYNKK